MSEQDVVSWTTLVTGYAGSGSLDIAREIFDRIPNRNVIAWNAMFAGYVSNGCFLESVLLFRDMLVCSSFHFKELNFLLHAHCPLSSYS
ncbi:hypothetical protein MKX03_032785 [Papaver bracteatum]|nr:hypothetical protein MKX03_032785 [Papaver bracteatum]